ncbi:MAG: hypothetical protein QY323_00545 [Patescibacteria group bacterium]|nr:MAG: hypothetical protein QY323_00545 [Patescibacteria group bacterium]
MDTTSVALEQLRAFNRMVSETPELRSRLVEGSYDVLQQQQARLFAALRGRLKKSGTDGEGSQGGRMRAYADAAAALLLTAWSAASRRADIVVFAVDMISADGDHDFRLDGLYRALRARNLRTVEVLHTLIGSTTLAHARSRKRAAAYHEAFEILARLWFRFCRCRPKLRALAAALPCEAFPEGERPFIRKLALQSMEAALYAPFKVRLYRWLLRRLKPCAVLGIDDTRYYHDLVAAARDLGIPFHAFQHGLYTVSHVGWLDDGYGSNAKKIRPDTLVVWSEYWKRELLRLGTYFSENDLLIGGSPKREKDINPPPPSPSGGFGVLVPYETGAPKHEVSVFLKAFLDDPAITVFFKARPDMTHEAQLKEYGLETSPRLVIVEKDVESRLPDIHAVVGVCSTYLYDALAFRRPVVIIETSRTSGMAMVHNGLAGFLPKGSDAAALKSLAASSQSKAEERARAYLGGGVSLDQTLDALLAGS